MSVKKVENNWNDNIKKSHSWLKNETSLLFRIISKIKTDFTLNIIKKLKQKLMHISYFAVSLRTGLFSKNANRKESLESIDLFAGKLRYGNKELKYLSKADYESILTNEQIIEMIQSDLVYRPGIDIDNNLNLISSIIFHMTFLFKKRYINRQSSQLPST